MTSLLLAAALAASAAPHPLDPLSASEIESVYAILKEKGLVSDGVFTPYVALEEPAKSWSDEPAPRRARVVVYDRSANKMGESIVDLKAKEATWTERPGGQPNVMLEEFEKFPAVVKADERWRAAMKKRGLDPDKLWVDLWAPGPMSAAEKKSGKRLLRALAYVSEGNKNPYAHPVEGVVALLDANARKVVDLVDSGIVPVSTAKGDFDDASSPPARPGLKPLEVSQPQGPSFELKGHHVRWQNWDFRFALHPREGPVLYRVAYQDGKELRPVLYRASLSEMLVPYGDADPNWSFRNAFDEGEYGIGRMAGPIEPLKDAPANAVFVAADFADDLGKPYKVEKAMALFERDGGLLWKHLDVFVANQNQSRRARELVLTFIATIANYDYQLSWVFRQDGTIGVECGLTGIMLAKGVSAMSELDLGHDTAHNSHLVAPGVVAPHHQHFFNFRLDFDVDGTANRALEHNVRSGASPLGNAMIMEETVLASEKKARRDMSLASARKWKVVSASRRNELGGATGFALIPGENSLVYLTDSSPARRKGRFVDHHVWFTKYDPEQLHAAGWFPNQGEEGKGLPEWTADDAKLDGEDLVLWYTFGVTHIPRPEDWPVMPTHSTGFKLMPNGFFPRNPALDVR